MEHYGPGEIVTELDFMEATSKRVVEVTSGDYSKGGGIPVGAPYASMPGGVTMMEWIALDYDYGGREFLQDKVYEKLNIKYLGGIPQHGCCINSSRPIERLSDIEGALMRDFGLKGELAAKLGFEVTYVPFPECYLALSTGVIEALDMIHYTVMDMHFYEVAQYITLPDIVPYLGAGAWCSMDAWNELSPDLQEVVQETYDSFSYSYARDQLVLDKVGLTMFEEAGGTIYYLPEEDVQVMKEKAVEVWEEAAAADPISAEFIAMYKDYMAMLGYK